MKKLIGWFGLALNALALPLAAQNTNVFDLREGDRVVLIGDTLIEREQTHGQIEFFLTTRHPERHVTFRNLGWSADTPLGVSRAGFDPAAKGFDRLKEQLALVKPTVAFIGYGMANSFEGEAGRSRFAGEMNKLMDTVQASAGETPVRFVLLSPIRHENLPEPMPDPSPHNAQLALYTTVIRELAAQRGAHFVNLFEALDSAKAAAGTPPVTDNGIHLNEYGYRRAAEAIAAALGWEPPAWRLGLTKEGKARIGSYGTQPLEVEQSGKSVRLVTLDEQLVLPRLSGDDGSLPVQSPPCRMQIVNFKEGLFDLKIDGKFLRTVSAVELMGGLVIDRGPQWDQAEQLRQTIVKKNELFFHRYRPQNNTYLFLFRKHEQGQNAREIPQFDPLIEAQEKRIAEVRRPVKHTFEILPSAGAAAAVASEMAAKPAKPIDHTPLPHPKFDLDANLEISLWAENPLLAKPIQMNFDAQGRLWVASSEIYPQIKPGQEATDRIIVLEDTDGDGKAEKSTVFAEGLLIPTAVVPGDGGVYVGQSTELLHFKDSNGDGKADQRQVVLAGFGTEDTHHILHTLRWGQDGLLYMNQSIYIHTHTETPHGVVRLNSGGILGLRPQTMELGVVMKGLVNSWGHALDRFGQSFATDGAGGEGINWVVPQAMYVTYERARRILGSVSPGAYPKFCGLELIHSRHFPEDWQGNFVTCDFRAHRIVRFGIEEKDSAYLTREMPDLVRTKDVAFRPIDVKLGPDGALYIADWSNPIIQHGEVDFRDPRRDHEHGRIWRVSYKGGSTSPKLNLPQSTSATLLDVLLSPDDFTRNHARRILTERGATTVLPALAIWTRQQTNETALLEALWLYQSLDRVESKLLERLLEAGEPRVRAAAVRVLSTWQERIPAPPVTLASTMRGWPVAPLPLAHRQEVATSAALDLLAARVADSHPRVRMEALRALARIPTGRAAALALTAVDRPLDKHLEYALWLTINDLSEPWLAALKSGEWKMEGREKQLEYALKTIEPVQASAVLGQLLGDKPLPRDGSGPWIELIGQAGGGGQLKRLFEQALQGGFDDPATARALSALNQAARLRSARPDSDMTAVARFFSHAQEPVRTEAVRLVGAWKGQAKNVTEIAALAGDPATSTPVREAAFASLRDIGGKPASEALAPLTAKSQPASIRRPAVLALAAVQLDKAVPAAVELLNETSTEADALALWRSLLNSKGAAPALARALPKSGLSPVMARAGLRAAREGGRNEPDLVLALSRGAELDQGEVALSDAELKQLVADVNKKGDPARGEVVYRRKELSCVPCHAIGGAGGKVGPDMTSIGASAPVDYLIESVWFPNKKIKEGYHAITVETKDSQEFSGTLVRETGEQLILRDTANQEIAVAKNNITDRRMSTLSLMPAGLIDHLAPQERIDLFRFLSELGKAGPFDASKGNVARAWKLRPGIHTEEQKSDGSLPFQDLAGKEWLPAYANVDGRLPAEVLREGTVVANKYIGVVALYAAAQLQVAKAGLVKFTFAGSDGASLWINGKPVPAGAEVSADLSAGLHTIVARLDPKKLPASFRLESSDGTFVTP